MSLVSSVAPSASVRATTSVGTPSTSAARRAAVSVRMNCVGRDQHLAAEVPALLLARELVLEVHARRAGLDHRAHQLERVQRAAEPGLGVGDDRRDRTRMSRPSDHAIWSARVQRVVDPPDDGRHRVRRVQRLVGVGLSGRGSRRRRPASPRGRSPRARPSASRPPVRRSWRRAPRCSRACRAAPTAAARPSRRSCAPRGPSRAAGRRPQRSTAVRCRASAGRSPMALQLLRFAADPCLRRRVDHRVPPGCVGVMGPGTRKPSAEAKGRGRVRAV